MEIVVISYLLLQYCYYFYESVNLWLVTVTVPLHYCYITVTFLSQDMLLELVTVTVLLHIIGH